MAPRSEMRKLWDKYRAGKVVDLEDGCTHPVKMELLEKNQAVDRLLVSQRAAAADLELRNDELARLREENRQLRIENDLLQEQALSHEFDVETYRIEVSRLMEENKAQEVDLDSRIKIANDLNSQLSAVEKRLADVTVGEVPGA
ncbi:MAG: hypothetical protein ABFS03_03940 [Chloroflexota bacterium]